MTWIRLRQVKSEDIDGNRPLTNKPNGSGEPLDVTQELMATDTDRIIGYSKSTHRTKKSNDDSTRSQPTSDGSGMITSQNMETLHTLEDYFAIQVDRDGKPQILGAGGMGYVLIGKPLVGGALQAIKVCRDPQHEPRLEREFEILSKLPFEGFPFATGSFRDKQGNLCYSMKLVKGESLLAGYQAFHRLAKDQQETDKETIQFLETYLLVERPSGGYRLQELSEIFAGLLERFIDVATAVSTMHVEGFIHRDLKPENARIEARTRQSVILDFGLAKMQGQPDLFSDTHDFFVSDASNNALTRVGVVVGTLAYMSPEQAKGDPNAHTKATDVYALGAMLYHLITGRVAVAGLDPDGSPRNLHQLLSQIREGKIDPPIRLPAIRAAFPDLEAICSKAMALNPDQRYRTVKEMIIDLKAWSTGNPVKAYRDAVSGAKRLQYDFHHWKK